MPLEVIYVTRHGVSPTPIMSSVTVSGDGGGRCGVVLFYCKDALTCIPYGFLST